MGEETILEIEEILDRFQALQNPDAVTGLARVGVTQKMYGVSIPHLRALAKEIGKDHLLALQLWTYSWRETQILASMIADPKQVTGDLMEAWVLTFDNWEVCDQCCMNLFEKSRIAFEKCIEWSSRAEEFVKRAGLPTVEGFYTIHYQIS